MSTKYIVQSGDRTLEATITEHEGFYEIDIDGTVFTVDSHGDVNSPSRSLIIDGRAYEAATVPGRGGLDVNVSGDAFHVKVTDELWARTGAEDDDSGGGETVVSPMPGSVVKVLVELGQTVEPGQAVVIVEAMKMQNELAAVNGGVVASINVEAGDVVDQDAVLVVLDGEEEADGATS